MPSIQYAKNFIHDAPSRRIFARAVASFSCITSILACIFTGLDNIMHYYQTCRL